MMRIGLATFSLLMFLGGTPSARAYIDLAATLPSIIGESQKITVVEIVEFKREKRGLVLKEVRALKGELSADPIRHIVAAGEGAIVPRQILTWATPGARAIVFSSRNNALVCTGEGWYQVTRSGTGPWQLGKDRPDLPLAYYGSLPRLADGIEKMLAGKDAVLTVVAHGADNEGASFDLALNRMSLPGLVRTQRIRGTLKMPAMVMAASANPMYFIGTGTVDEADIPALLEKLKSPDAGIRAEAIDDLCTVGRKVKHLTKHLSPLLKDPTPRVRFAAASLILQTKPSDAMALEVLSKGLESKEASERRIAAKAIGFAGAGAKPLVEKLAALLKEDDEGTQITVLQALSLLGPTACSAAEAVTPLLEKNEMAIDAADTLGRMGPAASSALKPLAKLLTHEELPVRWAGVRAMSQIGGEDAKPAVEFMIRALPRASEVDGYNMMIYLALLGPVAKDAVPTIKSSRVKNPVLPTATIWAIEPDKSFPWMGGRGGFPGFGGGGPGGGGGPDFATLIYENYVHELGERLRPAVKVLAQKIMDGTAGEVPMWGYKILTSAPDTALEIFKPSLADKELKTRERAAVALGYMGPAAREAIEPVKAAIALSSNDREIALLNWCLREIGKE